MAVASPYPVSVTDAPFPYELFAIQKAVKACSQCGTSKTPQWREGPEGPKTLCNACGVKRCRLMRLSFDTKRKPLHSSKIAAGLYPQEHQDDEGCYLEPAPKQARKGHSKAFGHIQPYISHSKATEDSESLGTPAASLSAGLHSDSAEEDAWSPRCPSPPAMQKIPVSPTYADVGPECTAAVNLLAMSVKPQADSQGISSLAFMSEIAQHFLPKAEQASVDELHSASLFGQAQLSVPRPQSPRAQLHPHQHLMLDMQDLDRQVIVAEAAVAAVAQVLANKQAIATQARFALGHAQKRAKIAYDQTMAESVSLERLQHLFQAPRSK